MLARTGNREWAERLADRSIDLCRHSPGAIRAIGRLSCQPALYRGKLLISGRTRPGGRFANRGFFATYHIAAANKVRALNLIRRFERDAIPSTLRIEEGELDIPDLGSEGVLWIAAGRTFFVGSIDN